MTIQEAIKTGKPIKTPLMNDYLYANDGGFFSWLSDDSPVTLFPVSAMMSNDWVVLDVKDNVVSFPKKYIPTTPNNSPEAS
jgi:hypothetical protein